MKTSGTLGLVAVIGVVGAALYLGGPDALHGLVGKRQATARSASSAAESVPPPAVTVFRIGLEDFTETVLVTGTLVPRDEILIAPEVEGLRVVALEADEGTRVAKGDVLARLEHETIDAQLAQNAASLARAEAAIAQAKSQIEQAEAHLYETRASFERAKPLRQSGHIAESVYEQRDAAARTAEAQLLAARDGLRLAEAEKAQVEAQRRELVWRREKTEIRAPVDGIVSRRTTRLGAVALAALGEPMFRMIARGEIELDGEVTEADLAKVKQGQRAVVTIAGNGKVQGTVRLVPPEVDRATRLGRVRIFLGTDPVLRIGGFGRAVIETAKSRGLAVPRAAVMYGPEGAYVQLVREGKVVSRAIETGLSMGDLLEARSGLAEGDVVVARAGTFLRDGDAVRPVSSGTKVSRADK